MSNNKETWYVVQSYKKYASAPMAPTEIEGECKDDKFFHSWPAALDWIKDHPQSRLVRRVIQDEIVTLPWQL